MRPTELNEIIFDSPEHSNNKIIILTANSYRHHRFALRIQKEFPELVAAWYEYDNSINSENNSKSNQFEKSKVNILTRIIKLSFNLLINFFTNPLIVLKAHSFFYEKFLIKKYHKDSLLIEKDIFEFEINFLKQYCNVEKQKISYNDLNSLKLFEEISSHDAYFLLSLGGPLIPKKIINSVKGFAINQHSGNSPKYKGSKTILWALFHRDIQSLSSTVHLTTSSADSGPIFRRANVCLHPDDKPQHIFFKSVALGTELMIEVVEEIMKNKKVKAYDQSKNAGTTYLSKDFKNDFLLSVIKDFKSGILKKLMKFTSRV